MTAPGVEISMSVGYAPSGTLVRRRLEECIELGEHHCAGSGLHRVLIVGGGTEEVGVQLSGEAEVQAGEDRPTLAGTAHRPGRLLAQDPQLVGQSVGGEPCALLGQHADPGPQGEQLAADRIRLAGGALHLRAEGRQAVEGSRIAVTQPSVAEARRHRR